MRKELTENDLKEIVRQYALAERAMTEVWCRLRDSGVVPKSKYRKFSSISQRLSGAYWDLEDLIFGEVAKHKGQVYASDLVTKLVHFRHSTKDHSSIATVTPIHGEIS